MCFLYGVRDFRMPLAVTLCYHAEQERRDDEYGYSSFCGREAKSLPHFIEL
jgi:hypothetical protein